MSSGLSRKLKRAVAERAGFRCEYCRSPSRFSADPLSVEHIVPRSRNGTNEFDNLALACQGCNGFKFTAVESLDDVSGVVVSLFHSREQNWNDHFAWSEDFTFVLAKTPVGRATINKLRLNRIEVMNLRRLLRLIGAHPPAAG